ncbi:unnamed protein product [Arctogadus glacialis]
MEIDGSLKGLGGSEETVGEALEKTLEEALEKTVEEGLEEALEKTVEEGLEKKVEEGLEEALEKTVEEGLEEALEKTVEETVEEASGSALISGLLAIDLSVTVDKSSTAPGPNDTDRESDRQERGENKTA